MPQNTPSRNELLSQEFDSSLSAFDSADYDLSPEDRRMLDSWQRLGECLRSIPVESIDLSGGVLTQCVMPAANSDTATGFSSSTKRKSRSIVARLAAVLMAAAAVFMLAFNLSTNIDSSPFDGKLAELSLGASGIAAFGDPLTWDVVLVTVPDGDNRQVVRQLKQSFQSNGMQVHTAMLEDEYEQPELQDHFAGSMVQEDLLDVLTGENVEFGAEWNPEQIDDLDRGELLARFAESLKAPSRSEEHFGEMVVVFSPETMATIEDAVRDGKLERDALDSKVASLNSDEGTDSGANSRIKAPLDGSFGEGVPRPVLVVIRSRKPVVPIVKPKSGQHGSLWHRRNWVSVHNWIRPTECQFWA